MDHSKWTPSKKRINCDSIVMLSPITKTPVRQNNINRLRTSFQNSTSNFSVLPTHVTPPSGLAKFIARNPFEADLTNKLHISIMSPSVFSKVVSPSQKGSGFTWSIDEIALIQPAKIDEFPVQQMHCSDPEIEKNAQEAISRFFSENQIIPSPYDIRKNESEKNTDMKTPTRAHESINVSKESYKSKKEKRDSWTQTVLSLPPKLPPNVEEALKPYFNFTQDQNCENEEANSSNTSLRRKLFSNHDESQDESNSSISISPVKSENSQVHNLSPPQSGMFFHGTPLRSCSQIIQRTYGTPLAYSRDSSPFNVSPISNPGLNMSCQSIKSRNKSVARLDFTKDMSIEISAEEQKENQKSPTSENMCKTLFLDEIKMIPEKDINQYPLEEKYSDVTQMVITTENSMKFKYEDKENFASNNYNITDKSKFIDVCKTNFSESYALQQSNMLSGNYIQQIGFSSAQDTGYQTYSSSNLTSNMDSYSTSIKQKLHWDERIAQTDDEVQLSDWKDNMTNMISSTPSKFNRGISNF